MARGDTWSKMECEAIVADYIDMLFRECRGEPFNKAKHCRNLQNKLNNRSIGSIEFKHQNISAILLQEGHPYIIGYKPAKNYQHMLREVVLERLIIENDNLIEQENLLIHQSGKSFNDFYFKEIHNIIVDLPNVNFPKPKIVREPFFEYRSASNDVNYVQREARNRQLGKKGEEFVLEYEKFRLKCLDRDDLISDIKWTSKVQGDGTGYDIRSFEGQTDKELFIEVKTTNSGMYQPFLITKNEVCFSKKNSSQYKLYRLFCFSRNPKMFLLPGYVREHVTLEPQLYKAYV